MVLIRFLGVQKLAGFLRTHLPGWALIIPFVALAGMLSRRQGIILRALRGRLLLLPLRWWLPL